MKTDLNSSAIISEKMKAMRTKQQEPATMRRKNGEIRVMVTDDHAISRAGLAGVLQAEPDITVIGEAIDGRDAISKAMALKPDIIIMDVLMPRCNGLESMMEMKHRLPHTKVIMLTISEREDHLFQALRFGAQGYLSKADAIEDIVVAVRGVWDGKVMLSPPLATKLVAELHDDPEQPALSRREIQVLQMLGEGLTNTEISQNLFISESTVRTYVHRLMEKLRLKNRGEIVVYAAYHPFAKTNNPPPTRTSKK
ncbi:MAG: response regulator transcription factor [Chloroflexi bacterium]|nr:response regulator transcription factor [Chloroflexota bacterium]